VKPTGTGHDLRLTRMSHAVVDRWSRPDAALQQAEADGQRSSREGRAVYAPLVGRSALHFPGQPTIQSADGWTDGRTRERWGAGDDRQPRPTHKDHRLSDRSVGRSVGTSVPSTTRPRRAGGQAANAAGQCRATATTTAAARPHACSRLRATAAACPLTAAARSAAGRALPMTYRPPAATATAALAASLPCPPANANVKISIEKTPKLKLTTAKSNPHRPVSVVRIDDDRASPSSSSSSPPWWRPRLRWDGCLPPAAIDWRVEVVADIFSTSRRSKNRTETSRTTSEINQLTSGSQLRSKAPRFHVSIDVNITAQVSLSKRCTAWVPMTPPTSAAQALRHRAAEPITPLRNGSSLNWVWHCTQSR